MSDLQSIKDIEPSSLRNKKVLLRSDFNVPIKDGVVVGEHRLKKSLPTIKYLVEAGARVFIISHLGDQQASLAPVVEVLSRTVPATLAGWDDLDSVFQSSSGGVVVFENVRQNAGEENNNDDFARDLASQADIYVNDAFSVSHRCHASVVSMPKYLPAYAGLLFLSEYEHLKRLLDPVKPLVVILGGAKFSTKLPLVKQYLPLAREIFVVGALAHSFFKQKGYEVGQSLADEVEVDLADLIVEPKIKIPQDVLVKTPKGNQIKTLSEVAGDDIIYDAGPKTVEDILASLSDAETILWNGPLGHFENGYDEATKQVAKNVSRVKGYSVVGGGDTVKAIEVLEIENKFGFVSTAGGAMLEFLATGTLPGLEALQKK